MSTFAQLHNCHSCFNERSVVHKKKIECAGHKLKKKSFHRTFRPNLFQTVDTCVIGASYTTIGCALLSQISRTLSE